MIRGKNLDKELLIASNVTVFDLSGAAAYEMALFNPTRSITINNVYVSWVEVGSADTGIALNIGSTTTGGEYWTATSSVSQAAGTLETYTGGNLTLATIPANTPVYINHAGSKVGTGTVFIALSYTIN